MNNNDLKYIFKRIIVGVAIGLILFNIRKCNVNAENVNLSFSPYNNICYGTGFDTNNNFITLTNGDIVQKNVFSSANNSYSCSFTATRNQTYAFGLGTSSRWLGSRTGTIDLVFTVFGQGILNTNTNTYEYRELEGFSIGTSTNFSNNFKCDVGETQMPTDRENYSWSTTIVKCKNFPINTSNFYYIVINSFRSQRHFYISKNFQVETTTEQQISHDIIDSNTNGAIVEFNGIQIQNSATISALVAIPPYFYGKLRNTLHNDCPSLIINHMPFEDLIDYSTSNLDLKCMRSYMYDIMGENAYEWIGRVAGGAFILVFLLRLGKSFVRMFSLKNNDDEMWGGLS